MLRIKVMSRVCAEQYTRHQREEPFYILSIRSCKSSAPNFDMSNKMIQDIHYAIFSDTDQQYRVDAINEDNAYSILHWAHCLPENALVIVHCRAGVSRSSATAAALSRIFNGNDDEFWQFPPYTPNELVYYTIMKCQMMQDLWDETSAKAAANAAQQFDYFYRDDDEDDKDDERSHKAQRHEIL